MPAVQHRFDMEAREIEELYRGHRISRFPLRLFKIVNRFRLCLPDGTSQNPVKVFALRVDNPIVRNFGFSEMRNMETRKERESRKKLRPSGLTCTARGGLAVANQNIFEGGNTVKDLSIGKKLTIGFGVIVGMMVIVLTLAFINMKQADRTSDRVIRVNVAKIEKANAVIKAIDQIFYSVSVMMLTNDSSIVEEAKKVRDEKRKEQIAGYEELLKMEQTEKGKQLLNEVQELAAKGKVVNNKAAELAKAGNKEESISVYVKEARPIGLKNIELLEKLVLVQREEMEAAHAAAMKASAFYRTLLVVFGLLVIGVAIVMMTFLNRSITVPLAEGVKIADRLARGELNVEVVVDRKDEVGQLLQSMKNMVEKWRGVVSQITGTATNLSSAATELSASAEQMSRGSNVQAARASAVATSSEEMSQTILDVAKNASSISQSAMDTVKTAKDGAIVVNRAVEEVKEIAYTVNDSSKFVQSLGDRSKQIGEIVGVINDIADQTNLLALNAAIEAARAGEQGRGFAVVADEVRKLAERTANATSEIGNMIKSVQDEVGKAVDIMANATVKVDQGVKLSEEAGQSLGTIVKSVDGLQTIMTQIASATEEMSTTSEEISRDIEQIATISRETSSSSEQTAQASGELANLSTTLENIVREFRL